MAVVFLGYAAGKAVFAAQGRMGFPGGPVVSAAEHERYAREVMDVATTQWLGVVTGLLGVLLVMATVTPMGRRVPRNLMLLMLGAAFAGLGAGAVILIVDGFTGLFGVGWRWPHGVLGIIMLGLMAATMGSYARATKVSAIKAGATNAGAD
jgi:FtsH-binding integral membrane protein